MYTIITWNFSCIKEDCNVSSINGAVVGEARILSAAHKQSAKNVAA